MVGKYLIFLLLFILRSHKEIIFVLFSPNSPLKITLKDLLSVFLKQPRRVQVNLNNQKVFLNLRDIADLTNLFEIFLHRIYPLKTRRKKMLIWDIGSHSGFFAFYSSLLIPRAKIYCFEPDPDNFKNSLFNLKLNPLFSKRIKVWNFGFSNRKTTKKFYRYPFSLHNSLYKMYQPSIAIKAKFESFKNHLRKTKTKIDILKIDTEGGEYDILYPLKNKDFAKIGEIFLEIHNLDNTLKNEKSLITFLKRFYKKVKKRNNLYYFGN